MTIKEINQALGQDWFSEPDESLEPGTYIVYCDEDGSDVQWINVKDVISAKFGHDHFILKEKVKVTYPYSKTPNKEKTEVHSHYFTKWTGRGCSVITIK
jgi:hypothetical protein